MGFVFMLFDGSHSLLTMPVFRSYFKMALITSGDTVITLTPKEQIESATHKIQFIYKMSTTNIHAAADISFYFIADVDAR